MGCSEHLSTTEHGKPEDFVLRTGFRLCNPVSIGHALRLGGSRLLDVPRIAIPLEMRLVCGNLLLKPFPTWLFGTNGELERGLFNGVGRTYFWVGESGREIVGGTIKIQSAACDVNLARDF